MNDSVAVVNKMDKTDAEIVCLLKNENPDAWSYIFANAALPVVKYSHNRRILYDRRLSFLDVCGLLYEEMLFRKKIDLYRGGSLLGWMKCYVWGVIHEYCKKNPWAVSESEQSDPSHDTEAPESKAEMLELVDLCFRELWQENQLRAYVHLLKLKFDLSAREIKDLLGLSSENNVDQLFSRAVKDMQRLKRKYSNE